MVEEKFDVLVEDLMKNPRFREEYDAMKPEFDAARAEIDALANEQRDTVAVRTRVAFSHAATAQ